MCELNYRETKIKIGVKLGGSKVQFYLQKMKPLQGTTQTLTRVIDTWQSHMILTCGSQRLRLTVNVQIGLPGLILQRFIKPGDQIYELNYRGTKSEIKDKIGNQFYNFAKKLIKLKNIFLEDSVHKEVNKIRNKRRSH